MIACAIMVLPQVIRIVLLGWGRPIEACIVVALLDGQIWMMQRLLRDPVKEAHWYSGFGVPLCVLGMMASAVAV